MYGHVCFMQYRAERQVSCMYGHVRFMQYWDTCVLCNTRPRPSASHTTLPLSSSAFNLAHARLFTRPRPSAFNVARARPSPVLGLRPRIRPFPQSSSVFNLEDVSPRVPDYLETRVTPRPPTSVFLDSGTKMFDLGI